MRIYPRLSRQGMILIAIPLAFELVLVSCLAWLLHETEMQAAEAERIKALSVAGTNIHALVSRAAMDIFSYFHTSDERFRDRYLEKKREILHTLSTMRTLASDTPQQKESMRRLESLWRKFFEVTDEVEWSLSQGMSTRMRSFDDIKSLALMQQLMRLLQDEGDRMSRRELETHGNTPRQLEQLRLAIKWVLAAAALLSVALAIGLANFFRSSTMQRLAVLMDNTQRLGKREPLAPLLSGDDELAQLDKTFHAMAQALERSIRKERAVVDNAVDVICSIDSEGRFQALNPATKHLWDYDPKELVGRSLLDIVAPSDRQRTQEMIRTIKQERSTQVFENQILRQDGSAADMLWSVQWSDLENSLFCVVHDITEQKELENFRNQLIGMVSHDLKTPLTTVLSILDLLETPTAGALNDVGKRKVQSARKNLEQLYGLVEDLLEIQRLEAGKLDLKVDRVSTATMIEHAVEAVRGITTQRGLTIETPRTDRYVILDGNRIAQVLTNLLSNAAKFSPPAERITIELDDSNDHVEFRVIDRGRGIPPNMKEAIFERFRQVDLRDATEKGGTGLGLSICKAIVEAHGGTIGVESEEGRGSTFWIRLPAQPVEKSV